MKTNTKISQLELLAIGFGCLPAQAQYSGGSGTADDPYQIATAADLMLLGESPDDCHRHFILTADVDLDPSLPDRRIFEGAVIPKFSGRFDGDGYRISHLTIEGEENLGLFGTLESTAEISNLGLVDVNIVGLHYTVGALAGYIHHAAVIASYSSGKITGDRQAGGLVGYHYHGSITASYSSAAVSGGARIGGLVGENVCGSIVAGYSSGTVSGDGHVGGLVGSNSGSIAGSYSSAPVDGNWRAGGLVGSSGDGSNAGNYGSVTSSFWDVETSGHLSSAGGTGVTTAAMQDVGTFLAAGWDFVEETANGTCDYWQISPDDYPRLRYLGGDEPVMPEGSGTAEQPYLIRDPRDLGTVWFRPSAHYRLETPVDLAGGTWSVAVVPWFNGTFAGNGYVISNLHIEGNGYLGLFGRLSFAATVSRLNLEAVTVNGIGNCVGGMAGRNYGQIVACGSAGTVTGREDVGGLAGRTYSSITVSRSAGVVSGDWRVGGLAGYNDDGNIGTSYSSAAVSGDAMVGGLVGCDYGDDSDIFRSYAVGLVQGNEDVGGLVGSGEPERVTGCFWDTQTSGQPQSEGGTGLCTAELNVASTFFGWWCGNLWTIDEGQDYPRLWWEDLPGEPIPNPYGGGRGTETEPYLIYTAQQLDTIGLVPCDWDKHFKLMANINMSQYSYDRALIAPYTPSESRAFKGVFDGNGHTISHLTIEGRGYLGLFGLLKSGAEVKNLGVTEVDITGSRGHVGGIVGESNRSTVSGCFSTGAVRGGTYTGGLVGDLRGGSIVCCYSAADVAGNQSTGGLLGGNTFGTVTNCYSMGRVRFAPDVWPYIDDILFRVGGLVGLGLEEPGAPQSEVVGCFWDVEASSRGESDGGTGLTTAQMQTASTFLNAGWDFVDETENGTEDIWWIVEGQDYPRLWWERGGDPPL